MLPTDNTKKRFLLSFAFLAAVAAVLWFALKLLPLILPFLIGYLIALINNPAVDRLVHKAHWNRKLSAFLCVTLFLALVFLVGFLLCSLLIRELSGLLALIPPAVERLPEAMDGIYQRLLHMLENLSPELSEQVGKSISGMLDGLITLPEGAIMQILVFLYTLVSGLPGIALAAGTAVVSAYFFCMDYPRIRSFCLQQVSPKVQAFAMDVKNFAVHSVFRMLRAYLLLMLVTFLELLVGLWALRIPYTVTVALLISLVDALPILGTGTILIPWAAVLFLTGNPMLGIGILVLFVIISIVRSILEPKIVGDHVGLHPIVTLLCIFIGLKLYGLIGMFLVPIAVIVLNNLHKNGRLRLWKQPPA